MENVIFTDKSMFILYSSIGNSKVCRKSECGLAETNLSVTITHAEECVTIRGAMSAAGVVTLQFSEDIMEHYKYLNILRINVRCESTELNFSAVPYTPPII